MPPDRTLHLIAVPTAPRAKTGSALAPRPLLERLLPLALGLIYALALLSHARTGADYTEYELWAKVATSGNVFEISHDLGSPLGLPLSQWSHGPGFFFALGRLAFGGLVSDGTASLLMGWLAALTLAWATLDLLRWAASGNASWAALGAGWAFVGTHLGFYSTAYSSESFGHAGLAVAARWVLIPRRWRAFDSVAVGAACGVIVLSRVQYAPYALLALIAMGASLGTDGQRLSRRAIAGHVLIALIPIAIAAGQVMLVNRWMTGEWTRSPYSFGDEGFRSLDFTRPQILAVLVHPLHGWLLYHPLYALGFAALTWRAFVAPTWNERMLCRATALVVLGSFYLQASWYCWWLGFGSFGMRSLGITAIPLLLALVRQAHETKRAGGRAAWVAAATAASTWSYGLLWKNESNYGNFADFFRDQAMTLENAYIVASAIAAAIGATWMGARARRAGRQDAWIVAAAATLISWSLDYLMLSFHVIPGIRDLRGATGVAARAACMVVMSALIARALLAWTRGERRSRAADAVVGVGWTAAFVATAVLFCITAVKTEAFVSGRVERPREFSAYASQHMFDIKMTLEEYGMIPGFEEPRARLKGFVERWKSDR